MSNITHLFDLNIEATEHHLISTSPNLTITAQGTAGEADVFMASQYGEYNHVTGFETGTDKIKVPLELIREINTANPGASTYITVGTLPAANFDATLTEELMRNSSSYNVNNCIVYPTDGGGKVYYVSLGDTYSVVPIITLDAKPTLAAGDIEIV